MARNDDDGGTIDRTAILARRQRFIALALSSLAASCGDDQVGNGSSPMPCLDVAPQTESASATMGESATTDPSTSGTGSSGTPMPCLDVVPQTSSDTSGQTDSTSSTGTGTGSESSTSAETDDTTGKPQPCLSPPR